MTSRVSDADMIQKFNANSSIPRKIELRRTSDVKQQNYVSNGKKYTYNLLNSDTTDCSNIEYVLPDEATADKYNFTPSFTVLSMIDLEDASIPSKTKVLF